MHTMEYWKDLFQSIILERGLDYFQNGNVSELKVTDTGYSAIVEGSESYDVEIRINRGSVTDMYCSCPYAEDGTYCKHMAAALFAIDNLKYDSINLMTKQEVRDQKALIKVIDKIPENEIRKIVLDLANENDSLRNYFMIKYSDNVSDEVMTKLKNEVDKIAVNNSDGYGYVNWSNASDFINELENFLDEKVDILIEKNSLKEAFELTNYVFHCVGNTDIDDSEDETSYIANRCYEYWKQILYKADEAQKQYMHKWFETHQEDYVTDYLGEYIEGFLKDEFCDDKYMREQLKQLDKIIKKYENKTDCGSTYSPYYGCENAIIKRINIMKDLCYSQVEIDKFKKKYRNFSAIRELEIEEYLSKEQYDKAIEVLKESKNIDKDNFNLVLNYSRQLIEIYKRTGNTLEYKKELCYQVFSCQQFDLKYIKMLKVACNNDEWIEYREKILNLRLINSVRFSFLALESLYDKLLYEIIHSGTIDDLDQYENVLSKELPERTRNVYINYVIKEAERVCDRRGYKNLMRYLKKVSKYEGGKIEVEKISNVWKMQYKRRPAMMDELKQAGF